MTRKTQVAQSTIQECHTFHVEDKALSMGFHLIVLIILGLCGMSEVVWGLQSV